MKVANEHIDGLDGGNAMALTHEPRLGAACQRIGEQVAGRERFALDQGSDGLRADQVDLI